MKRSFLIVLALLVACGKRGDPHPPVPVIPQATSDLVVAQRGDKVILSWSYPALSTAGQKLGAVRRIIVYRTIEPLPVTQPPRDVKTLLPGDIDPTLPTSIALFAKVPPIGPQQFTRLRQQLDSLEQANIPAATVGAQLTYEDAPDFHTSDGRPVRIDYAVVTEGGTTRSALSNIASIVPLDVPAPPEGLTATAKAEGLLLEWKAPEKSITGTEKPHIIGYDIYRNAKGQALDSLPKPVNAAPVALTTYTDAPPFGDYEYRVAAVSYTGPPRIESELSAPASTTFKDLLPPPVPTGLTALVETNAVRLIWDPVVASDLAGYKIYRTEGTGIEQLRPVGRIPLTGLITDTNFRDTGVQHGISYFYEVTSIDKSGNESAPAKTDWVLVPKSVTPQP